MRNRTLKAELDHQDYNLLYIYFIHKLNVFVLIVFVAECFCVEANIRRLQVLNHFSFGLRISYCFYWAKKKQQRSRFLLTVYAFLLSWFCQYSMLLN